MNSLKEMIEIMKENCSKFQDSEQHLKVILTKNEINEKEKKLEESKRINEILLMSKKTFDENNFMVQKENELLKNELGILKSKYLELQDDLSLYQLNNPNTQLNVKKSINNPYINFNSRKEFDLPKKERESNKYLPENIMKSLIFDELKICSELFEKIQTINKESNRINPTWNEEFISYLSSNSYEKSILVVLKVLKEIQSSFLSLNEYYLSIKKQMKFEGYEHINENLLLPQASNFTMKTPPIQEYKNQVTSKPQENIQINEKNPKLIDTINANKQISEFPTQNLVSRRFQFEEDIEESLRNKLKEFNTEIKQMPIEDSIIANVSKSRTSGKKFNFKISEKPSFCLYNKKKGEFFDPYIQYGGKSILTSSAWSNLPRKSIGKSKATIVDEKTPKHRIQNQNEIKPTYHIKKNEEWCGMKEMFNQNESNQSIEKIVTPQRIF